MMMRGQENVIDERLKNPKFTGFFQGQANLDTGNMTGYYYNTHARITSKTSIK